MSIYEVIDGPSQVLEMRRFREAWRTHRKRAIRAGIGFDLTFQERMFIWRSSGHIYERGIRRGQYCMCRKGDLGPYSVGNVFIATNSENTRDAQLGRKRSEETRGRMSEAQSAYRDRLRAEKAK